MTTLQWGILGASKFAREHMAPAIHAAKGSVLSALATSSPGKARPFAEFVPGLRVFDSYEALLADDSIDVVYIPLPNSLHIPWTLKALEAGKHVLVEKPLAIKADEFDTVIAARDQSGLQVAEAFMIVHHPQWTRAREIVQSGGIGSLVHVDALFTYNNASRPENIRQQAALGGGGLADIGVYIVGAARYVTDEEPSDITLAQLRYENDVDVFAQVAARFPSFSYSGLVSMRMALAQHVTFHGDTGRLHVPVPFNPLGFGQAELHWQNRDHETRIERFPGVNQYVLQVEAFNRSVAGSEPFPCPLEFVRGTQAMIDAIKSQAQTR